MSAKRSSRIVDTKAHADVSSASWLSFVPPRRRGPLGVLAIFVLAAIAHAAAIPGGFIWEDLEVIALNPNINTPSGIINTWIGTNQPDYWPVDYSLLWLEYRLWGPWPPGYRLVNIAGHALNSILLWQILKRLNVPVPWLCGAVFAVHPVTVESVAWCIQSKTLYSTFFALASTLCFLRAFAARDAQATVGKSSLPLNRWYFAALLLFALGMLTKSSVLMWPFILLVLRWWQQRRLTWSDFASAAPFLVISVMLGAISHWFQTHNSIGTDAALIRDDGIVSRVLLAGRAVWFYIGKDLLPIQLALVYPRFPLGIQSIWTFLPDAALLAIAAAAWHWRATWGAAVLAAGAYVIINLAPTLGLVNIYFMRFSLVSDHWQYIALPGVVALVIGGSAALLKRLKLSAVVGPFAAVGVLLFLTVLCVQHATVYGAPDSELLWSGVLEQSPDSWLGHHELGRVYGNRGDHARAAEQFHESLRINPEHAMSATNLGLQYFFLQRQAEAVPLFRRAIELEPYRSDPHFYLAMALLESGQSASAIDQLRFNVDKFPADLRSAELLVMSLAAINNSALRDGPAAVTLGEQLCRLTNSPPASHLNALAAAYAEVGRFDDAVRTASMALERATAEGNEPLAAIIGQRLRLFREGQPARVGR